jgi:adenylate cyclase
MATAAAGQPAIMRWMLRGALSLAVLLPFVLHLAGATPIALLDRIEAYAYDVRVRLDLQGPRADARVVILDMDEKTLAAEGWPLPRDRLAHLIDLLFERHRIRALGSDILFAEPDRSAGAALLQQLAREQLADLPGFAERAAALAPALDHDRRFAEALRGRPVVLSVFFSAARTPAGRAGSGALCAPAIDAKAAALHAVDFVEAQSYGGNLPLLQTAASRCGFFDNPRVDADGVFRRVPLLQRYQNALYPSLALALVRTALGDVPVDLAYSTEDSRTSLDLDHLRVGELSVPVDGEVAALVPYRGRFGSFPYVSVTDVLNQRVPAEQMRDAIVLLGTTAAGLLDLRSTPVGQNFAGVEVHASLVAGMLEQSIKRRPAWSAGVEFSLLLGIALLLGLLFPRLSPLAGAALAGGIVLAVVALALVLWHSADFVLPLGVPVLFTLALFMAHLLYGYFVEARRARDTQHKFGQYVPREVVEQMAASDEAISMEGDTREMSVLFSDVRGFTDISEKLEARELSALMNAFLTAQTGVVQRHRGTIDKYMGDAIMAFWGAPLADPEHACHALEAALEMTRSVRELDPAFAQRGWPPLHIGVGVHCGKMHVGNMGSSFRVAYTVMGDAVNLGSRIEGLTKVYGVSVLCTQAVRDAAPRDWAFREIDRVCVKGRAEIVSIFEPLGPKDALDPALRQDLARHRAAMKQYWDRRWDEAEAELFGLSRSGRPHAVYELFLQRIAEFRRQPPPADWDGAHRFDHK